MGRGGSSLCVLGEEYPPVGMRMGVPDKQECVDPWSPAVGRTPGLNEGARGQDGV